MSTLDCEQWIIRAQNSNGEKRYQQALEELNHAQVLCPNNIEVYLTRSITYLRLKDYHPAVDAASEAIARPQERSVKNLEGYIYRSLAYLELQDYGHAIADCNAFIQCVKGGLVAEGEGACYIYFTRGKAYAGLGYYKRALADFNKSGWVCKEVWPGDWKFKDWRANVHMNISYQRGNAYLAFGKYQKAFRELDLVKTSYRYPKYTPIELGGYGIDQETLHSDWELARLLMEEKSDSRDETQKQWWQFWK